MKYVYLVYEECHGLVGTYDTQEKATKRVIQDILESCPEILDEEPDFNGPVAWGWDGACFWTREEVL